MKELSIFVDESGDFGEYDYHSPFYIISMVLHEQSVDIESDLKVFEDELAIIGWANIVYMQDQCSERKRNIVGIV